MVSSFVLLPVPFPTKFSTFTLRQMKLFFGSILWSEQNGFSFTGLVGSQIKIFLPSGLSPIRLQVESSLGQSLQMEVQVSISRTVLMGSSVTWRTDINWGFQSSGKGHSREKGLKSKRDWTEGWIEEVKRIIALQNIIHSENWIHKGWKATLE